MARADFNMIPFDHHFTAGSPDEVTKNFNVEVTANQNLTDDAYMLIQVQGISSVDSITLNDETFERGRRASACARAAVLGG